MDKFNQPSRPGQRRPRGGNPGGKPGGQQNRPGGGGNRSGRPGSGGSRSGGGGRSGGGKRSARPSMSGLIQSVKKSDTRQGKQMQAGAGGGQVKPDRPMKKWDNRESGMLYPGSQFQDKPHQFSGREKTLRVIPLGGLEEIGMNCMAIEYGEDIIIVDVGWMFPDESMPGIDYVIPDVSYLEKKKKNIRGIFITHGHLDHIGAAPYLFPKLDFPKVYATQLCRAMVDSNLQEFGLSDRVSWQTVKYDDIYQVGQFKIEFFHVNHNIPEGMGIVITTPVGSIVHTGDFKFDENPVADSPAEIEKIKAFGDRGVLLAMCDSTNVERPGHTLSEQLIGDNLDKLIAEARGRVIFATFSTLISRLQQTIWAAQKHGRKVTIVGRSMLRNVEICQRLGYLDIPKDIFVDIRDLKKYRDNEILLLCTGSQADEMSALVRMSTGDHKQVQIKQGDTVILSSSPIPGNERRVEQMMDNLFRHGADVIYSKLLDIHSSGHGQQDELKQMLELLRPKHFMPIHGEYRKRVMHGRLANTVGIKPENVHLLDNGRVLELNQKGDAGMTKEKVGGNLVFVDGLGVGDVGNVVLRDRKHMAEDGMFVLIISVDRKNGRMIGSPDIISRGFIYVREAGDLLKQVRAEVGRIMPAKGRADQAALKAKLRDDVGEFLYEKTQRQPMVIPVILEI